MGAFCPDCGSSLTRKEVEEKNRLFCEKCSQIIWQNPKPVAWLLIQRKDEHLLVKRANEPDKGEWDIPGGFLELHESFEEAAVRELKEETGIELEVEDIGIYNTLSFNRGENFVVGIVFHTEVNDLLEFKAGDDAAEARFWKIEDFEDNNETLRDVCKPAF